MNDRLKRFEEFKVWFKKHITGKERKEGQLFFNALLRAFGNAGVLEVGATCEEPVKKKTGRTGFADLVWKPRVIIELKERGTNLKKHYHQAEEYWFQLVPDRPKYMALCNFDEFWIFDLNKQLNDPVHIIQTDEIATDFGALAFLFPRQEEPIFNNNNVEVTEDAAEIVGQLYLSLNKRKVESHRAQRFVLQLVVALFSEDVGLIPKYTLHKILKEAVDKPNDLVTQKELLSLFEAMSTDAQNKKPKRYSEIPFFNGGIFNHVEPVELTFEEIDLLYEASKQNWSKVRPSIFGAIFEGSMDPEKRHGHGVHYTSELDIQKIVNPTIIRPFRERIEKAKNKKELGKILKDLQEFQVLDPACGSGNFLYVSFREMRRLEYEILERMEKNFDPKQIRMSSISPKNFFGIDTNVFGQELAKVALCIGRKLSADEFGIADNVLPFDNLDDNFIPKDALFVDWPEADAIIGNPPFQSKNKMVEAFGRNYVNSLRKKYPKVPGRADYCVYWFRKTHDSLRENGRAGLVGTNTIRQNFSRIGGLDYIVANGGSIEEAVGTQVWSGDAVVHVSIVNWVKGSGRKTKKLFLQNGDSTDSPWEIFELSRIPSSLSPRYDVTTAIRLNININSCGCFQGQTHGHEGFLLSKTEVDTLIRKESKDFKKIVHPYMIAEELLGQINPKPNRWCIDLSQYDDILAAKKYKFAFEIIEEKVLPDMLKLAEKERDDLQKETGPRQSHLKHWWHFWRHRPELLAALEGKDRFIACAQVTKRPIFEFISTQIRPNAALMAFPLADDYSFGILQSTVHWTWFKERCSTMKGDPRYTTESVFDTFPWPQETTIKLVRDISEVSRSLRAERRNQMANSKLNLRQIYKTLETNGASKLRDIHDELDSLILRAYGFRDKSQLLKNLLELNFEISRLEARKRIVVGPGLPPCVRNSKPFITDDCIVP